MGRIGITTTKIFLSFLIQEKEKEPEERKKRPVKRDVIKQFSSSSMQIAITGR